MPGTLISTLFATTNPKKRVWVKRKKTTAWTIDRKLLFSFFIYSLKREDVWYSVEIELIGWTRTSENNKYATFSGGRAIVCPKLYSHLE